MDTSNQYYKTEFEYYLQQVDANTKEIIKNISKEIFVSVCESSISMAKAATELGIHFNTFKKKAIEFGCYKPNPGLKGGKRKPNPKIDLEEILEGKHPQFQTYKLKLRLLNE